MPCYSPYQKDEYNFPCGKCDYCVSRRISEWLLRLTKENERSTSAYFVTLTYNTDYVPITSKGLMSLRKKDVQKFFKRLRKKNKQKIKYYLVGEYGTERMRPHYHIILFNMDTPNSKNTDYNTQEVTKAIDKAWGLGNVHAGDVNAITIKYTVGYINKRGKIPQFEGDDRLPEYSNMSQKLGDNYITPQTIKYHKQNLTNVFATLQEQKIPLPRYYKDKIYSKRERFILKCEAQKLHDSQTDEQLQENDAKRLKRGYTRKYRQQRL